MIPYHLYLYDEDFDIFNGKLPPIIESGFGDQLERLREILKNRNLTEIYYGLDSLNWMLKKGGELEFEASIKEVEEKGQAFLSRVKALKYFSEQFDISEQSHFQNAKWSDYFALLALAYILESLHSGNSGVKDLDDFVFTGQYPFKLDWPVECMDAICTSERFLIIENSPSNTTQIMSERGKKGGKRKAAKFANVMKNCITLYSEKYYNRSNREAAKRILKELSIEDLEVFSTDEPENTVERWISRYKKGLI